MESVNLTFIYTLKKWNLDTITERKIFIINWLKFTLVRFLHNHLKLLLSLLFFQTLTIASVESDFYNIVHKVCKAYRVGVVVENMDLNYIGSNKLSFTITLDSRRNNYNMVLMVGFIASGKAIDEVFYQNNKKKESWKEIDVTVQVPLTRNGMVVKAKADASFVVQFARGEISTLEFTDKVIINKN